MATWKVARPTKVCALSGRPLEPGAAVLAALFGAEEEVSDDKVRGAGFERRDYAVDGADPAALDAAVAGAYCVWRTRVPSEDGPRVPRLDLGMAKDLLERILAENDPSRASAAWTLAMLLVRKRQLTLVGERDGALVLRRPRGEGTFTVPSVVVAEAEVEQLEQELSRLFEV
jgi:hypothetical protein